MKQQQKHLKIKLKILSEYIENEKIEEKQTTLMFLLFAFPLYIMQHNQHIFSLKLDILHNKCYNNDMKPNTKNQTKRILYVEVAYIIDRRHAL